MKSITTMKTDQFIVVIFLVIQKNNLDFSIDE